MSDPSFCTTKEVCERFRISRATLNRWVHRRFFPKPIRIGPRTIRYRLSDIERMAAGCLPHSRTDGVVEAGWELEQDDGADLSGKD